MKVRAAFVGTGHISEYHFAALSRLKDAEFVGVFDVDREKAEKWAAAANAKAFSSLKALKDAGAEVIHVLTPPHTHAAVAIQALELGCHVYIEKPMALDIQECDAIALAARKSGKKICVGHSLLFDPQVRRALEMVRKGALGRVVSVDILRSSIYPPYGGGPLPPQYRSASYPFNDLGVHALYLFEAFLGRIEDVNAQWASLGGDPNLAFDEWRAFVRCKNGMGQFQLSWNAKPLQSQIIIQGTKGVLRVDLFLMSQSLRSSLPLPKAVERVANALTDALPMFLDVPRNAFRFVTRKALPYHGLQDLVRAFYDSIATGQPSPVLPEDARSSIYWTGRICHAADLEHSEKQALLCSPGNASPKNGLILITGASGCLGGTVARALLSSGKKLRLLVRRVPDKVDPNVEIVVGNLGNPEAVDRAVRGADFVVHAGAAMTGGWPEHECATVVGTKNVLDACVKHNVKKLVHISSMSVLDWAGAPADAILDESSSLEPRAEERGHYTRAKLAAEQLVLDYTNRRNVNAVILRPGKIFGGGQPLLSPAIGWKVKERWIMLGDGEVRIPLVYIDDVVEAVLGALRCPTLETNIVQITDDVQLTQNEVLKLCEGEKVRCVHTPRWMVYSLAACVHMVFRLLKRSSPVSVYRMKSGLARRKFRSLNAKLLAWEPRIGLIEGIRREIGHQQSPSVTTSSDEGSSGDCEKGADVPVPVSGSRDEN